VLVLEQTILATTDLTQTTSGCKKLANPTVINFKSNPHEFFMIFLFYKKFTHFNWLNEKIFCKISTKIDKKTAKINSWRLVLRD